MLDRRQRRPSSMRRGVRRSSTSISTKRTMLEALVEDGYLEGLE
jgi:hypothetical protein